MRNLARRRPIFNSKADFQHELAWEIHIAEPNIKIRLERPPKKPIPGVNRVDIWPEGDTKIVLLELKYTHDLQKKLLIGDEQFNPSLGQGGRGKIVEDLCRLEALVDSMPASP